MFDRPDVAQSCSIGLMSPNHVQSAWCHPIMFNWTYHYTHLPEATHFQSGYIIDHSATVCVCVCTFREEPRPLSTQVDIAEHMNTWLTAWYPNQVAIHTQNIPIDSQANFLGLQCYMISTKVLYHIAGKVGGSYIWRIR